MSRVLCITGMHRSGTSLTASWIHKCGLQIDDGNLMGASVGNRLGHFEDADFVKLHSKYIRRLWPHSKSWIVLHPKKIDKGLKVEFISDARELILKRDKYEFWGWKDPRSILFWICGKN